MKKKLHITLILSMSFVMLIGYTNCGRGFTQVGELQERENGSTDGDRTPDGIDPGSVTGNCEAALAEAFKATYYPFLKTTCTSCHGDSGVRPEKLAASNLSISYQAFQTAGVSRIDVNAQDPTHAAGVTGTMNSSTIASLRPQWNTAFAAFTACKTNSEVLTPGATALALDPKNIPSLYFGETTTATTFTWSLSGDEVTPSHIAFPAVFTIGVQIEYQAVATGGKRAVGYRFSNPRLQMLTGEYEVELESLIVKVNGKSLEDLVALKSVRKIARGVDPVLLHDGSVLAELTSISSTDMISVDFGWVAIRKRTDNPPLPQRPTLTVTQTETRGLQVPVRIAPASTLASNQIRRYCLTTKPDVPSSTAAPCPGYEGALTTGWIAVAAGTAAFNANFSFVDLGIAPVDGQTYTLRLWVANSDLKIASEPATTTVKYDATAPPPVHPGTYRISASLNNDPVTGMQVAELTVGAAYNPGETVTYCVRLTATNADALKALPPNDCFVYSSIPRYVGIPASGARYLQIFARDKAGNVSLRAPAANDTELLAIYQPTRVDNTLGYIKYVQLMDGSGMARAVFANRCASCHGAGKANQARYDVSTFAGATAKTGTAYKLKGYVNGTVTAHPADGISEKERILLNNWLTASSVPFDN